MARGASLHQRTYLMRHKRRCRTHHFVHQLCGKTHLVAHQRRCRRQPRRTTQSHLSLCELRPRKDIALKHQQVNQPRECVCNQPRPKFGTKTMNNISLRINEARLSPAVVHGPRAMGKRDFLHQNKSIVLLVEMCVEICSFLLFVCWYLLYWSKCVLKFVLFCCLCAGICCIGRNVC